MQVLGVGKTSTAGEFLHFLPKKSFWASRPPKSPLHPRGIAGAGVPAVAVQRGRGHGEHSWTDTHSWTGGRCRAGLVLKVTAVFQRRAFRNRTVSQQQQQLQFYFANRAQHPPALSCSRQAELARCSGSTRAGVTSKPRNGKRPEAAAKLNIYPRFSPRPEGLRWVSRITAKTPLGCCVPRRVSREMWLETIFSFCRARNNAGDGRKSFLSAV